MAATVAIAAKPHGGMVRYPDVSKTHIAFLYANDLWLVEKDGGMAADIWLFNLKDHTSKKITDWEGTDTQPMWHGVEPDIEVVDDPAAMYGGIDVQPDAAIQHMLDELKTNPYKKPKRPPYPDRSGMGIKEKDK